METRHIGELEVSAVGLGCNNFGMRIGEDETLTVVRAALDAGITYFDTADVYGQTRSEEFLGAALVGRRDEAIVATKFGSMGSADGSLSGGHPQWVRRAADDSLARLRVDVIDHYQYHRLDPDVPLEDTMGALEELVEAGKVREIGCSNFDPQLIDSASTISSEKGWRPFASVQNRYSVLHREPEDGVVASCADHHMGLVPYFPLESGLLTGKVGLDGQPPADSRLGNMPEDRRARFLDKKRLDAVAALSAFAQDHGHTILELAMAYLLSEPTVASVISGATKPEQVQSNVAAAGWQMTEAERAECRALAP